MMMQWWEVGVFMFAVIVFAVVMVVREMHQKPKK